MYVNISRTESGAETDTVRPQVHDGGLGVVAIDEGQGADKGVAVNEYLVKTLRPKDEAGGRIVILLLDRNRCRLN
nr:kinesin motor domain-containing protein [Tanacetum cinerariifolium]